MRIFLAEDEQDLNAIIVQKLTEDGYSVDHCFDGRTAIDILSCTEYDAVILDIMMPKMNGDEAAKCIRKINPSIPIVAMSAQSEYSIDQTIMNDSISKPIDEQKLNHILRKYVA